MAPTFISYRRDDAAGYAGRLRESLERRIGEARVFRDVDTLRPGQDFVQAIDTRLRECRVLLAIIGREWLDARDADGHRRLDDPYDLVRLEIGAGLARPDVLVVPVLVEGASMPPAAALPEAIRPLARRHAVSVRDETWDADIERLAAMITGVSSSPPGIAAWRSSRLFRSAVLASVVVAAFLVGARWMAPTDRTGEPAATPPNVDRVDAGPTSAGAPYTIDVPRVAEAAFQHLTYTLVSGNVVFRENGPELRLRMRLSNAGGTSVNFWDDSFRLAIGSQILAPTSGLNVVMAAHSLGYGVVTFALTRETGGATLQIRQLGSVAEIPIDLTPTGRPPVDEVAEIADSLSQALVADVITRPEPLLAGSGMSVTMERAVRRQFANAVRLRLVLRIHNTARFPRSGGELTLRAITGDQAVAPWDFTETPIGAESSISTDAVFDLPAAATSATLRARLGEIAYERAIDLR